MRICIYKPALFYLITLSCIWACGPDTGTAKTGSGPNIILIMADDLGYETIGANGGSSYQTPHLDQLAAN